MNMLFSPPKSLIWALAKATVPWIPLWFSCPDPFETNQLKLPLTQSPPQIFHVLTILLLLLSRFSCVQLCATPETAAH